VLADDETPAVLVGSAVTMTAQLNRPVKDVEGTMDGKTVSLMHMGANSYTFDVTISKPGPKRWEIKATDKFGFVGKTASRTILALADRAPTVLLRVPFGEKMDDAKDKTASRPASRKSIIRLKPGDRLPVVYDITDDVALTRAALVIFADNRPVPAMPLALVPAKNHAAGQRTIDLASPHLADASRITFHAEAQDAMPTRKQPGKSKSFTIIVDKGEKTAARDRVAKAEKKQLEEGLKKVLDKLREAKTRTDNLKGELKKARGPADKLPQAAQEKSPNWRNNSPTPKRRQGTSPGNSQTTEPTSESPESSEKSQIPKSKRLARRSRRSASPTAPMSIAGKRCMVSRGTAVMWAPPKIVTIPGISFLMVSRSLFACIM